MTVFPSAGSCLVLVGASALMLRAAWTDTRDYIISNQLVLALLGLFAVYAWLAADWAALKWDIAFAALMFAAMLVFYSLGWMGGGDVKILAVAFLWTGLAGALPFAIFLALFSSAHAIAAKLRLVKSQITVTGRRRIPFAPSIAAALICTFALRSLQPA